MMSVASKERPPFKADYKRGNR